MYLLVGKKAIYIYRVHAHVRKAEDRYSSFGCFSECYPGQEKLV